MQPVKLFISLSHSIYLSIYLPKWKEWEEVDIYKEEEKKHWNLETQQKIVIKS